MRLKFNFLYNNALPTLIRLCINIVDDIICSGRTNVSSAIRLASQEDKKNNITEIPPPIIQLKLNAVDTCFSFASFFCITAAPNPASDKLMQIAITPLIAAK